MAVEHTVICDGCGKRAPAAVLDPTEFGKRSGWWELGRSTNKHHACGAPTCVQAVIAHFIERLHATQESGSMFQIVVY